MYDAINSDVGNIPPNAYAVGGYLNGLYTWSLGDWQRFSGWWVPIWIYIPGRTVNGQADGQAAAMLSNGESLGLKPGSTVVLDVEGGDAGPVSAHYAGDWCAAVRANGMSPSIYTSRSTWGVLQPAGPDDWWIAEWTGQPHSIPGAAAVQYADPGPYDLSLCQPAFPRRTAPPPPPPPPPPAVQEDIMVVIESAAGVKSVWTVGTDNNIYRAIQNGPEGVYGVYQLTGGPVPNGSGAVKELIARFAANGAEEAYIQFGDVSTYTSWKNPGDPGFTAWTRIGV